MRCSASIAVCGVAYLLGLAPALGVEPLSETAARLHEAESKGAYAAAIVEPAIATASLQQAAGDHLAAVTHLRRAIHLRRINDGLDTLSQIPLLERLLESQLGMGADLDADVTQARLYQLRLQATEAHTDRLRAIRQYTDWHRKRYLSGGSVRSYRHLLAMHGAHAREIDRLVSAPESDAMALVPHLYAQLQVEYLVSDYQGGRAPAGLQFRAGQAGTGAHAAVTDLEGERFRLMRGNNYRNGRATVERILEIVDAWPEASAADAARARIALGDWHLWWNSPGLAIRRYREAWEVYANDGDPATAPGSLFDAPVALPAAAVAGIPRSPGDVVREARARMRFTVSRLGQARGIEVLEIDASHDDGAHLVMHRMLKGSRFRPVLENGDTVPARDIERTFSIRY